MYNLFILIIELNLLFDCNSMLFDSIWSFFKWPDDPALAGLQATYCHLMSCSKLFSLCHLDPWVCQLVLMVVSNRLFWEVSKWQCCSHLVRSGRSSSNLLFSHVAGRLVHSGRSSSDLVSSHVAGCLVHSGRSLSDLVSSHVAGRLVRSGRSSGAWRRSCPTYTCSWSTPGRNSWRTSTATLTNNTRSTRRSVGQRFVCQWQWSQSVLSLMRNNFCFHFALLSILFHCISLLSAPSIHQYLNFI